MRNENLPSAVCRLPSAVCRLPSAVKNIFIFLRMEIVFWLANWYSEGSSVFSAWSLDRASPYYYQQE